MCIPYNIIARINCFVLPFLFLFSVLRSHNISHNIATTRSHHQAKSNRLLHCLPCQSKTRQTYILHSVNLRKSTLPEFWSQLLSNQVFFQTQRLVLFHPTMIDFKIFFIYMIPKNFPKGPSTLVAIYIGDCLVKPLQSFFVFQCNLTQL